MPGGDRRFRGLVAAHAVSTYGNYLNLIALSLFSYEVTGTAFGIGAFMALRLAAGVLAGLAAGVLVRPHNRRTFMICTDLAQAAAMTVLAAHAETGVLLLSAVVVVLGAGNTLFNVALRSAVPAMVGRDNRVQANGLLVTARSLATVLGFASAAPVIGVGGYRAAFALNALSFLVSAAALLFLRLRTRDEATAGSSEAAAASSTRLGTAVLAPLLLGMLLLRGADALGSSSHNVALPVVAELSDPGSPAVFMTQFWAAWAVGSLLPHQLVKRWERWRQALEDERAFAVGTCLMSVSFVLAFTGLPGPALVAVALAAGLADGFTDIAYTSRLQTEPDARRSRLFGLSAVAETSGFAVGTVVSAWALETAPPLHVVAGFHGIALCGAVAFLVLAGRHRSGANAPETESGEKERI